MIKVELLKPLNGATIGSEAEFNEADAKQLEAKGAVKIVKAERKPEPKSKPSVKSD